MLAPLGGARQIPKGCEGACYSFLTDEGGAGVFQHFFLCFSNEGVREVTADLKGVHTLKKVKNHCYSIIKT